MFGARSRAVVAVFLFLVSALAVAKKKEPQPLIILWPSQDAATLKLAFSPFRQMGAYAGQMTLVSDVVVQNLTGKIMPRASFTVSLLDSNQVRIGSGLLVVEDLNPGESAKVLFQCNSVGPPAVLSIVAKNISGVPTSTKTISVNVISVPPGATLKVDGKDAGTTPALFRFTAGTHNLELHKDGYADAKTPLDVNPDEAPGGSITITLGGLVDDTVELRDGSILVGDVISMSLEFVVMRVNGQDQTLDRNKIKKIFLVERTVTHTVIEQQPPTKPGPPVPPANLQTPHR